MPIPDHAEQLLRILAPAAGTALRARYLRHLKGPPSSADVLAMDGVTPALTDALNRPDKGLIERTITWLDHPDHHLLVLGTPEFPPMLARTATHQLALFVDGDPCALWHPSIAVIGSRNPSFIGKENADFFVEGLVRAGLAITSGLARGIDARAHEATIRFHGIPIGVLGTGPDVAYPTSNRKLQEQVATHGAVVSQFFPGVTPQRHHFPQRNHVIAGLSLGTLIVEGRQGSGAMGTAHAAISAGRDVFAVPGSIHNPLYRGNHQMIRDGACLVQSVPEILGELDYIRMRSAEDLANLPDSLKSALDEPLSTDAIENPFKDPDYYRLWQCFDDDPTDMGSLVERTGLTFPQVSVILVALETEGKVISLDGRYQRVHHRRALSGAGRG